MANIDKILVPVDFSPYSKAALDYAWFLSQRLDAKMDLLHVCKPSEVRGTDDVAVLHRGVPGSTMEVYSEAEIQEKLTTFLGQAGLNRKVRNDEIEQGDDAAEVIVGVAKKKGYDLIVMGTQGRAGISKLLMGSVTQKVLQSAPCPVMAIRLPVD